MCTLDSCVYGGNCNETIAGVVGVVSCLKAETTRPCAVEHAGERNVKVVFFLVGRAGVYRPFADYHVGVAVDEFQRYDRVELLGRA